MHFPPKTRANNSRQQVLSAVRYMTTIDALPLRRPRGDLRLNLTLVIMPKDDSDDEDPDLGAKNTRRKRTRFFGVGTQPIKRRACDRGEWEEFLEPVCSSPHIFFYFVGRFLIASAGALDFALRLGRPSMLYFFRLFPSYPSLTGVVSETTTTPIPRYGMATRQSASTCTQMAKSASLPHSPTAAH